MTLCALDGMWPQRWRLRLDRGLRGFDVGIEVACDLAASRRSSVTFFRRRCVLVPDERTYDALLALANPVSLCESSPVYCRLAVDRIAEPGQQ